MKRYNHAHDIAFEVVTNDPIGANITAEEFRRAILLRLARLSDAELIEAIGGPFDAYEVDEGVAL